MKLTVVGCGYVGLSLSVLLSTNNEVIALDNNESRVKSINNHINYLKDDYIDDYIKNKTLNLRATNDYKEAFSDRDYIIISVPTNFNEVTQSLDTTIIESVIKSIIDIDKNPKVVIKSTIPIGFTDYIKEKYHIKNIFFSPEFLREGKALYDLLYPSRIIVGDKTKEAIDFANLLKNSSLKKDTPIKLMGSKEAEAVKLFSNSYLALRVAFFNEVDTFASINHLNTKDIIEGMCLDDRIGAFYNNPSFGYGGYCLPKDTKQLLKSFDGIDEAIIKSIIDSNEKRKDFICEDVLNRNVKTIGIYRLISKTDSDNINNSVMYDIINRLKNNGLNIIIYEPLINLYEDFTITNDLNELYDKSDIILVNRLDENIESLKRKVYTKDIFNT